MGNDFNVTREQDRAASSLSALKGIGKPNFEKSLYESEPPETDDALLACSGLQEDKKRRQLCLSRV
jgi:hypothetical protein